MKNPLINSLRRCLAIVVAGGLLFTTAQATTVIAPDFAELVNESDYVIRAVVRSVTSEYKASSSGTGRKIITKVELEVKEVLAGTPPATVVLQMWGGRMGEVEQVLEGAPRFKVGDEDILFVSGNGRTICPLYSMMYGRYPILREAGSGREYVARNNRLPLRDTAEVALPLMEGGARELQGRLVNPAQALSPAQFAQQIRAAVKPDYVRAKQG